MEQYNVTGMSCAACSARVEKAVSQSAGRHSLLRVSLLTNSMGVEGTADEAAHHRGGGDSGIRTLPRKAARAAGGARSIRRQAGRMTS